MANKSNVIPLAVDPRSNQIEEIVDRAFELWLAREFRNTSPAENLIEAMLERARKSRTQACTRRSGPQRPILQHRAKVVPIR